ncbi:hypothetical protein A33M_3983 [Rhodovulum sp. PH10]|nr:hypothetical protein A33M_3983 [Rhodovulum sp. PH10]
MADERALSGQFASSRHGEPRENCLPRTSADARVRGRTTRSLKRIADV